MTTMLDMTLPNLSPGTTDPTFAQAAEIALRVNLPHASQRRVMWALFQKPWALHHLSGLARAAGLPVSSTARALHDLVGQGLVMEEHLDDPVATLRIFRPRMDYPRCARLRRQFVNAYGPPAYLVASLRREPNVIAALVFGSVAKGQDRADSDIDLLVVTAQPGQVVHHDMGNGLGIPLDEPGTRREIHMVQVSLPDLDRRIAADPSCFWSAVLAGPVLPVHGDVTALVQRYHPQREDVTALPLNDATWTRDSDARHRMSA